MQSVDQAFPSSTNKKSPRKLGCAFILLPISAIIMVALSIWYTYTSYMFLTTELSGTVNSVWNYAPMEAQPTHPSSATPMKVSNTE